MDARNTEGASAHYFSGTSSQKATPKKGILKHRASSDFSSLSSGSFDSKLLEQNTALNGSSKNMHWDEMNILATYHPPDKDYGFMKVDEPPTPFNFSTHTPNVNSNQTDEYSIDFNDLKNKLDKCASLTPKVMRTRSLDHESGRSKEDDEVDEDALNRNKEFEKHRKAHYNEFKMAQLLRSQMSDEDEDQDNCLDDNSNLCLLPQSLKIKNHNNLIYKILLSLQHCNNVQYEFFAVPGSYCGGED
ncbi:phosphatase inhibitor 2 [Brachionus plicatilis]|uniref:Phosphatase inhibitor 2 n=1 Tax=Brachionus plicatilis TaxID=10195 RepID=A0A3M7S558_BRAPC|nr:phosphatase inhibitor 2 [Brachionus plicatilis]